MTLQVQVHTLHRALGTDDDERIGAELIALVHRALARGGAPASAVAIRPDRIDIVPMGPLIAAKSPPAMFLAGLTRVGLDDPRGALAVGVMGRFLLKRHPSDSGVPLAMVFLEWTDCRWWQWRALLAPPGEIQDETETILRAVDGVPKPPHLGGWWSLARRSQVEFRFERQAPAMVH